MSFEVSPILSNGMYENAIGVMVTLPFLVSFYSG